MLIFSGHHQDLYKVRWNISKCTEHLFYAKKYIEGRTVYAHRLVAEREGWDVAGMVVDHINGDGLDNRVENLRVITQGQNSINQRKRKSCTSKFRGVYKFRDKWQARIMLDYKRKHLGTFATEVEAANAYNLAACEMYGEFAVLNSI